MIINSYNTANYTQNHKPNFGAKFFHSKSLEKIAEYAVEHGKFDKLNQARKNIDNFYMTTRLRVDVGISEKGMPFVTFAKFVPKDGIVAPKSLNDYIMKKVTLISSDKQQDPFKFAMEKIIRMGNNCLNNKLFKATVISNKK